MWLRTVVAQLSVDAVLSTIFRHLSNDVDLGGSLPLPAAALRGVGLEGAEDAPCDAAEQPGRPPQCFRRFQQLSSGARLAPAIVHCPRSCVDELSTIVERCRLVLCLPPCEASRRKLLGALPLQQGSQARCALVSTIFRHLSDGAQPVLVHGMQLC